MPSGIFISYRRQDAQMAAGRLADCVKEAFGSASIFRDVETIDPGVDFVDALDRALKECVAMLVVIGPQWLGITDKHGRRRLDDTNDWTRIEVATALKRNIRVVPVVLDGTAMPDDTELPDDLKALSRRQALDLSDKRWRADVDRLVDTLARIPGLQRVPPGPDIPEPPKPGPLPEREGTLERATRGVKKTLMWIGGVMVALVVIGVMVDESTDDPFVPEPVLPVTPAATNPAPAPAPRPVAPIAANDVSGLWHSTTGESYRMAQQGAQVQVAILLGNQQIGQGWGTAGSQGVQLAMQAVMNNIPVELACEMALDAGGRSMTGTCINTQTGQMAPARIFR
jgi:hypothetical protein